MGPDLLSFAATGSAHPDIATPLISHFLFPISALIPTSQLPPQETPSPGGEEVVGTLGYSSAGSGVSRSFFAASKAAAAPSAAVPRRPIDSCVSPTPVAGNVVTGSSDGFGVGGLGGAGGFGGLGWQHFAEQVPSLQQHVPFGQSLSCVQPWSMHTPASHVPPASQSASEQQARQL